MRNGNVLVYSCSGCSSAAQMANRIAVRLDRQAVAEMSCIAGVGGGVKALVRKAKDAGVIIGIDGCPLACVRACLAQHGLRPHIHYDLSKMGVEKQYHTDFDPAAAEDIGNYIADDVKKALKRRGDSGCPGT